MDLPLALTLALTIVAGLALRNERIWTTASVLLLDWSACSAYQLETGDAYPWPVFGAIDYVAAFVILKLLRQPASLWQCLIALTYAVELICHGGVGFAALTGAIGNFSAVAAKYYGWHLLHVIAWGQAFIVGAWISVELARRGGLSDRRARPYRAGVDGMAGHPRSQKG